MTRVYSLSQFAAPKYRTTLRKRFGVRGGLRVINRYFSTTGMPIMRMKNRKRAMA